MTGVLWAYLFIFVASVWLEAIFAIAFYYIFFVKFVIIKEEYKEGSRQLWKRNLLCKIWLPSQL